jgi:hypothetical protein
MNLLTSNILHIGLRLFVFSTLVLFIGLVEVRFHKAKVRGGFERLLELVAVFVMGFVLRGLILLTRGF